MSEVFLGQIMMAGFSYAPKGFAQCNGQMMSVQQNQALFSLLGTQFGGDGRSTFGLPDMRSRVPAGAGTSADPTWTPPPLSIGAPGGQESVTLSAPQLPPHAHMIQARLSAGDRKVPGDAVIGQASVALYGNAATNPVLLNGLTCEPTGGSQPHPNLQPYCTINFCIALSGIFPSRA